MKKRQRRRMNLTFGYIGSGNKTSLFTRKPKTPFRKIKEIYGEELEHFTTKIRNSEDKKTPFSVEDKEKIRNNVKRQLKREQRKNIRALLIVFFVIIVIITLFNYYFSEIREYLKLLKSPLVCNKI